jgi:biotin carboxylase
MNIGIVTKKDRWDLIREAFELNNVQLGYIGHDLDLNDIDGVFVKQTIPEDSYENAFNKIMTEMDLNILFSTAGNDRHSSMDALIANEISEKNILYIGPSKEAAEICFSKSRTKEYFTKLQITTPRYRLINFPNELYKLDELQFPLIRKEDRGWSGFKMNYFNNDNELTNIIDSLSYPSIFEEYVEGEEYTVNLLKWNNVISEFPIIYKGETKLNQHPLMKARITPCKIDPLIEKKMYNIAKELANEIDIDGWIDFDFIYSKKDEKVYILEINSRFSGSTRILSKCTRQNPYNLLLGEALGNLSLENSYNAKLFSLEIPIPSEFRNHKILLDDNDFLFFPNYEGGTGLLTLSGDTFNNLQIKINSALNRIYPPEEIKVLLDLIQKKGKIKIG